MQRYCNQGLRLGFVSALVCLVGIFVPQAAAQTAVPPSPVPVSRLDMTGDDLITTSDVTRITSAWEESQRSGTCMVPFFASRDVNGDGCLDVVDIQLVAAQLGTVSGGNPPLLGAAARAAASPTTFVVNSSGNAPDSNTSDNVCDTGKTITVQNAREPECTLRAAIEQANRRPGHETINFNVRNSDGTYPNVVTIYPDARGVVAYDPTMNSNFAIESWFAINDPNNDGVTIDGYSQPGAKANDQDVGGNAVIKIELKGRRQFYVHGLLISSSNNVIRGLALYNWDRQIMIDDTKARYNHIEGNFIGTNAAQTFKSSNMDTHHSEGLRLEHKASYNVIGCGAFTGDNQFVPCTDRLMINAARNIVIGNGNDGIHLQGDVFHNRIVGNYIGLRQDGETCDFKKGWETNRDNCGNGRDAVDFELGPQYNWLGGETPAERNVISGNGSEGIEISHGRTTQYNRVVGNYFGLNAAGTRAVRNINNGISYEDTVNRNVTYNNVVSGNAGNGLRFYNSAFENEYRNNLVGFAADGVTAIPNGVLNASLPAQEQKGDNGILIMGGSHHNLIVGNRIANHPGHGIYLTNSPTSGTENRDGLKTAYNTISQNSLSNNGGKGIYWSGTSTSAPNRGLQAPLLDPQKATTRSVSGTACEHCVIEVFVADKAKAGGADDAGEGKTFIGSGTADASGTFTVQTSETAPGTIVTATATDSNGNTSQFSTNVAVTIDIGATETVVAATAHAEMTATAQAGATARAATAMAQTATAQVAQTQTAIVLQTSPSLAETATTQAATATVQARPAPFDPKYKVLLPMIAR